MAEPGVVGDRDDPARALVAAWDKVGEDGLVADQHNDGRRVGNDEPRRHCARLETGADALQRRDVEIADERPERDIFAAGDETVLVVDLLAYARDAADAVDDRSGVEEAQTIAVAFAAHERVTLWTRLAARHPRYEHAIAEAGANAGEELVVIQHEKVAHRYGALGPHQNGGAAALRGAAGFEVALEHAPFLIRAVDPFFRLSQP